MDIKFLIQSCAMVLAIVFALLSFINLKDNKSKSFAYLGLEAYASFVILIS